VIDRMTSESNRLLAKIREQSDLNGREKLKMSFRKSLDRPVQDEIFAAAPNFRNNPKLFWSLLHDTIKEAVPNYIQPIIEQGVRDGTIQTDYPKQFAELIILVANVWMNPMIFEDTMEESFGKAMVFQQMMKGLGLEIIDEKIIDRLL